MLLSLCALASALLPGPRLATTRVGSVVLLGAGGDPGQGRGATVSPLTTRASHPRRHSASRACLEDLGRLTVPQLKQRCREAGLKLSGRKAQLVQRLLSTEADTASSVEEASTESHSAPGSSTAAASAKLRMSKKAKLWHEELMAQQKDELAELRKQVEDLKEENEQLNSSGAAGQGTSTFETEVTHAACTVAFSKFKNGTEFKQALAALNANTTSTGIAALRKELVSTIINNHVP